PEGEVDVEISGAAGADRDSRAGGDQPRDVHRAGPGPGRSLRGARHQPQRAPRGAGEPAPPVRARRPHPGALRALVHLDDQGRLGLLVREPRRRGHAHHAAAAHHPLGAGTGPGARPRGRPAGRDPGREAAVLDLRSDLDHAGLRGLLAAHLLHRHPVHPVLQHLPGLAAVHLPGGHLGHRLALVLGERPTGDHAGRGPRPRPGRLHDPVRALRDARGHPARLHQHRALQGPLREGHDLEARGPERHDPGGDPGGAPDPGHLHRRGHHRADLPGPRHRLAADHLDPRQRHPGDHGDHLRVLLPGGAVQPGGGSALRLARSADLPPLAMTPPNGAASEAVAHALAPARARRTASLWSEGWRRFRKHRLATFGAAALAVMVIAVAAGPLVYRVPIDEIDFRAKLKGPSRAHPLGTDDLGQDLLARMLYGGRISLAVGVTAMLIAITVGTVVGATAGHLGGASDHVLMRLTDLFLCLTQLQLLLLLVYLFRDTLKNVLGPEMGVFVLVVIVIGGLRWMPVARLVRAQFLSLREKEFVEAARSLGAPPLRQVIRHILPNAVGPVIVAGTIDVAAAILAESSLSFLGLGFPPDIPTWGRILFDAKDNLDFAPHWAIFPGTAIFLTVLSINYIGDGLRDALDPRKVLS